MSCLVAGMSFAHPQIMKLSLLSAATVCLVAPLLFAGRSFAQTASPQSQSVQPGEASSDADRGHSVSLTFSPLHLILPEVRIMAEFKVNPTFSVAALGGYGSVSPSAVGASGVVDNITVW